MVAYWSAEESPEIHQQECVQEITEPCLPSASSPLTKPSFNPVSKLKVLKLPKQMTLHVSNVPTI